jgi:hypothetical protein
VSWQRRLPQVWAALLPLLLLGPALGRGYVLSYDMVWVPDLALRSDFLGLGTALPRAVPSDAVVAVLDEVLPGMLLQKLVLYGALVLAGLGYARLVEGPTVARLAAVSLAIWNPFVVERLGIGHWPVLLGYAVVPWLVLAGRRIREDGSLPTSVWFLLPLGSLSASAGVVSATVLLVCGLTRVRRTWVTLAALCVAVNAPWLVAGVRHADTAAGAAGYEVFGLHAEGSLPAPLAALGLGGIWNAEVVPASRGGVMGWVALVLLGGLTALGAWSWYRRRRGSEATRLLILWGAGYVLALVTWASPALVEWLGGRVPGAALLRDGTRTLALCAPLVICLVSSGVTVLLGRAAGSAARIGVGVACVLLPVAMMTDAAWGLGGDLRPADYPGSWSTARRAMPQESGDLVALPFTSYRAPAWNGGRKVLDPLGRYLEPNYVVNDELGVSGRPVTGEDPRVPQVEAALGLATPQARATALADLGIRWVARERDAPGAGDPAYDAEVAGTVVYDDTLLQLVEIDAAPRRAESTAWSRGELACAWAAFLAVLLIGSVKVVRTAVSR